jgi:hypothetical protein
VLSQEELEKLQKQNSRIVSAFSALKLEKNALKNWDIFYKRNETRFFKVSFLFLLPAHRKLAESLIIFEIILTENDSNKNMCFLLSYFKK